MRYFSNLILGAIFGGMIGGSIGLLLAPKSGRALRSDISNYASNVKDEVKRASEEKRVELTTELERLREPTPDAM